MLDLHTFPPWIQLRVSHRLSPIVIRSFHLQHLCLAFSHPSASIVPASPIWSVLHVVPAIHVGCS